MEERFLRTGAVEPRAKERRLPPVARFLAAGITRFVGMVAGAAGVAVGIALIIGWWRDSDLLRAATVGLYVGGAVLVFVPLLSAGGQRFDAGEYEIYEVDTDPETRRLRQSGAWAYVVVGVVLIGLGVLLETLTR